MHKLPAHKRITQLGFIHLLPIVLVGIFLVLGAYLLFTKVFAQTVNTAEPTITIVRPTDGSNVPLEAYTYVSVHATDDIKVRQVFIGLDYIGEVGNVGCALTEVSEGRTFTTSEDLGCNLWFGEPNTTYNIFAWVEDNDGHRAQTDIKVSTMTTAASPTPTPTVAPTPVPTPTPTQSIYGTITGTIYSSTGKLVSGAKITLRVNNKNTTYFSDAQGKYIIPNLPAGKYSITYVAAGYSQQKTTATVSAGQTLVIDVTLKPK